MTEQEERREDDAFDDVLSRMLEDALRGRDPTLLKMVRCDLEEASLTDPPVSMSGTMLALHASASKDTQSPIAGHAGVLESLLCLLERLDELEPDQWLVRARSQRTR